MPVSIISICNLALSHVGGFSIAALDERSTEARLCGQHYDFCRDEVLRSFNWSFATKIAALALVSGVSVPNWEYAYSLPADCLNARRLVFEGSRALSDRQQLFTILASSAGTAKYLCTNLEDAWLEYTARITDSTMYDSQFVTAFSYRLGADMATALSGVDGKRRELMNFFSMSIAEAKASSANEQKDPQKFDRYVKARL